MKNEELEYFVKYKEYSYLHCKWISEEDLLEEGDTK